MSLTSPDILIIDDDQELCGILDKYFSTRSYNFSCINNPIADLDTYKAINPDIILLDVNFPDTTGFEILKILRKESNIPIIMLTARGDEFDRVLGLELGADDYLSKPFYFRELMARISAVLRRCQYSKENPDSTNSKELICLEDLELNLQSMSLKKSGETVNLRSKEFELLKFLMQKSGEVISKEDLSEAILGEKFESIDRRLDVHLSRVRKKIGPRPNGEERIVTIRNTGIIFISGKDKK